MALTKVIGAGLGTLTEDQVLGGATPTLTIGDAGAEDAKIVFDGNAQDFYVGLDDSSDILAIGNGSDVGASRAIIVDANGIIRQSLQPAFSARPSASQSDMAINAVNVIAFGTEIYDQNSDFASNTFTAPVTGKYFLGFTTYLINVDTGATYVQFAIVTSNRSYYALNDPNFSSDLLYLDINIGIVADMDAGDTAQVQYHQGGGNAQADVNTDTTFMGYLLG